MEKWENKNEVAKVCEECGCVVATEDAVEIGDKWYCRDCVAECYECGEWVLKADAIYCAENGELYCADCAENELIWCEHCDTYALDADAHMVTVSRYGRTEVWCSDCCDNYAVVCDDCGELMQENIATEIRGGGCVCSCCRDEYYYYCDECGEYVCRDDWDEEAVCCTQCADKTLIKSYHSGEHRAKKYTKVGACRSQWRGYWRGVGVELEVEHPRDSNWARDEELAHNIFDIYNNLVFERDGSVDKGFEIITQPHTEEAFEKIPWLDILNACIDAGYQSHNGGNCGLHCHLSREWFGSTEEKQYISIAKLIRFYDIFYNDIVKVSRRDLSQAQRWAQPSNTAGQKEASAIAKNKKYMGRYQAVNVSNRDTVEVRIMRGTLNYNSFKACVDFVVTTAKNARRVKWSQVRNAAAWLDGLKPETLAYIKARNAFIGII